MYNYSVGATLKYGFQALILNAVVPTTYYVMSPKKS